MPSIRIMAVHIEAVDENGGTQKKAAVAKSCVTSGRTCAFFKKG